MSRDGQVKQRQHFFHHGDTICHPMAKSRYVTILRAHSTAVSVTTSFAGWSCCGCARWSCCGCARWSCCGCARWSCCGCARWSCCSCARWSCCGSARRSPTLECILKALCSRVGKNTHTDDVVQSFINSLVQIFFFLSLKV